ncbi:peptidoglycan DD-metalloendopeptidase family protein [Nocardia amamiensis]|uniref:Peptidoglycan DD-metalloendopeptidase family protein n=1 Tax=Nocardia amamiensis TaxID=404578 RepID=A0ABS0CPX9_9NOCA|nr:peptidoglycan DD-metalloendopeptidase family protein [Nocardia amamiensis]MBF6298205.1 peptidoglycan DD-metalloendopeptidase family protein [Nocardia amamiensis]
MPTRYLPLAVGTYTISSPYGPREDGFHYGLDFAAPKGTPFYAPLDGIVVEGAERTGVQGFGRWVWLDCQHAAGVDIIIGHGDPAVRSGDSVRAGQLIGYVNSHGQSSGPHAHLELWTPPGRVGGRAVDPATWFAHALDPGAATGRTRMDRPVTRTDLSPNCHGGGRDVDWIAIHTQEGRGKASAIIRYLKDPAPAGDPGRAVSYNAVVDDRETVLVVPWDHNPWSASNANNRADHILMAGTFAGWSRGKWLETDTADGVDENLMLTRTAALVAWRCTERGIPIEYVGGTGSSAPPRRPGICGHVDFGQWGGGHTDPGRDFPWDELIRRARAFAEGDDMSAIRFTNYEGTEVDAATALKFIDQRVWQNERMLMAVLDQLLGKGAGKKIRDDAAAEFEAWPQNGGRSLNDMAAAIGAHVGVPNAVDKKAVTK